MKRIFATLSAIVLFGVLSIQAAPVSPARALDVAKRVFATQSSTKAADNIRIIWDGETAATKGTQPAIYIVARDGGGFVIVAGDDNVQPVLGISFENRFETKNMPDNVKSWMEYIKAYVRAVPEQSPEIRVRWANLANTKSALEGVTDEDTHSRTCEWDQREPANLLSPTPPDVEGKSVCGCLPLAMAELMTWFGWPTGSTSLLKSYSYSYKNDTGESKKFDVPEHTMNTEYYLWDQLQLLRTPDQYKECTDDEVRNSLAQLVYDCGVSVMAQFLPGGTGASDLIAISAFKQHFRYNKAARLEMMEGYSPSAWVRLLREQVLAHPVLYCALGNVGGHAYLLDGVARYEGDDVFHINFGWSGACNGYYYAAYQTMERSGVEIEFDSEISAMIDLVPDYAGNTKDDQLFYWDMLDTGLSVDGPIVAGEPFTLVVNGVVSWGDDPYNGKLKLVLEDRFGNPTSWEQDLADYSETEMRSAWPVDLSCSVTIDDIEFGQQLVIYWLNRNTMNWEPLGYDPASYIFKLIGGGYEESAIISKLPLVPVPFIDTRPPYNAGDYFEFRLKNHDASYKDSQWTVSKINDDGTVTKLCDKVKPAEKEVRLTSSGRYKVEVDYRSEHLVAYITVN